MSEVLDECKISNFTMKEEDVGMTIKSSKKKFTWEFNLNGQKHIIALYDSKISGRRKVEADGKVHFPKQLVLDLFSLSFDIANLVISLVQIGTKFECRINSYPFDYLMELERNKKFYKKVGGSPLDPSKSKKKGKKSPKFNLNLLQNNQGGNASVDTSPAAIETKKFDFTIKPMVVKDKIPSKFDFKIFENNQNKMQHNSTKPDEPKINLIDFWTEKQNNNITESGIGLELPKEESSRLKQFGDFSKEIKNVTPKDKIETIIAEPDKKENKKKPKELRDLFDIFGLDAKENIEPPVIFTEAKVQEKSEIKDSGINYPKFENLEKLKSIEYNESNDKLKNTQINIQPQISQYINDINDLFG